jgi:integrase
LSGARPGEVAGLTAADVDLPSKTVILGEHKTAEQTGKDRLIVLADEGVAILRRLIAARPEGLLFPGEKGQRLNANNVSCRMRRLCERVGVKAFCYGYRHRFATDALSNGVPDAHVATLMGHSGTAMLHKHYSHLTGATTVLRDALGKVR